MAVVVFTFSVLQEPAINQMLDYMLAVLIYSLVLSTAIIRKSKKFIKVDIAKELKS